jgi:hypothetical protein
VTVARTIRASLVCLAVVVSFITLHELVHLGVGRIFGLPTHFLNPTGAGVSPEIGATAPAAALAWMNGVAPLFTMVAGVLALLAAPGVRRRAPRVAEALAWIAILGVPYIGLQMMIVAAPAELRGNGSDSPAVLVGYFGISPITRLLIACAGVAASIAAGFALPRALGDFSPRDMPRDPPTATVPPLRWVMAGVAWLAGLFLLLRGVARIASDPAHGNPGLLVLSTVLWAIGLTFVVRWRSPNPRFIRDRWIIPGAIASAVLVAFGVIYPSDYAVMPLALLPSLVTAAWASNRT